MVRSSYFSEKLYNDAYLKSKFLDLTETNSKITKQFEEIFKLDLPQWWKLKYPAREVSLK